MGERLTMMTDNVCNKALRSPGRYTYLAKVWGAASDIGIDGGNKGIICDRHVRSVAVADDPCHQR